MSHAKLLSSPKSHYVACTTCSNLVEVEDGHSAICGQCGTKQHNMQPRSARLALVFSLTALIFYVPAMLFPFMTIELYGSRNSSTILGGVRELAAGGSVAIALIVLLASVIIPVLKLVILFYLSLSARWKTRQHFKTKLYHFVEAIGRWSMLDIFLLAVLVAIMKLGPWTTVRPGLGAILFALVVIFTMLASAVFDPKLLWKAETENE